MKMNVTKTTVLKGAFSLFILLSLLSTANAVNYIWIGTASQNWSTAANWSPSGIPGSADNISITTSATINLTANVQVNNLSMSNSAQLKLNGFNCTVFGNLTLSGVTIQSTGGSLLTTTSSNTRLVNLTGSTFNAGLTLEAERFTLADNIFNNPASFIKKGTLISQASGNNTFNAAVSFRLSSGSLFQLGVLRADIFNSTVNVRNDSTSFIDIAYGDDGVNTHTFNGNIIVESTTASFGGSGIRFGENGGKSILRPGYTIAVGPAGFNLGWLSLKNFTQQGTTPQRLTLNYSATSQFAITGPSASYSQLNLGPNVVFNGDVKFEASNPSLNGCTFNGPNSTYISKLIGGNNLITNSGGNIFNSPIDTLRNETTSTWTFAATNPDVFNGDVLFENTIGTPSSVFRLANGASTTFTGNVTFKYRFSSNAQNAPVQFGNNNVYFTGSKAQTISRVMVSVNTPAGSTFTTHESIPRMIIDKASNHVTLHNSMNGLTITSQLSLIKGNFNTASNAIPIIGPSGSVINTSNASYVSGPITKRGNTAFVFPVGKNGLYRPVSISAPGTINNYTAEYFDVNPDASYALSNREASLGWVNNKEYWTLSNPGTRDVRVTLSTGANSSTIFGMDQLVVANWDGTKWLNAGSGGYTGTNTNGNLVTQNPMTTLNTPFTFGVPTTVFTPLKGVEIDFHVKAEKAKVVVSFTARGVSGIERFVVERSEDRVHFEEVRSFRNTVNTDIEDVNLAVEDIDPFKGTSYYRIRMIANDNKSSFTATKMIAFDKQVDFIAYPSIATSYFTLKGPVQQIQQVFLVDALGSIKKSVNNSFGSPIQIGDMIPGIYWVKIMLTNKEVVNQKIIIRK